jgi:hypothetical protein
MPTKGFIITASTTTEQQNAAICAYSILASNPDASITICVSGHPESVLQHLREPFDHIVQVPFGEGAPHRRAYDWQLYWATPYDHTIVIDCMTIANQNFDTTWEYLIDNHSIFFDTKKYDFKGDLIELDKEVYNEYQMDHLRSDIWFFSKNDESLEYFKLLDPIMRDWYQALLKIVEARFVPEEFDIDLMHSTVIAMHWGNEYCIGHDIFNIVDLPIAEQYFYHKCPNKWTQYLNTWIDRDLTFKVQNYNQYGIVYYGHPEFGKQDIYERFRDYYTEQTSKV